MSDYPIVKLDFEVEVQSAINTDTFKVLNVAENPDEKWLNAFVAGAPQNTWVSVLTPETYTPNWTDQTITDAVKAWAETNFPPSLKRA